MARIVAVKEYLEKTLKDESKPWTKMFVLAEEKTGIDRLYIFVGSLILLAVYLVFGLGQQLVCNIVGFVYPAYQSMKALESPKKEDDTKWLTYWVVFAVFTIIEFFSEYIVCWFPVYWLFKCIFYVWLMAPTEYNGSLILYRRIIRPKYIQYQPGLDKFLSNARDTDTLGLSFITIPKHLKTKLECFCTMGYTGVACIFAICVIIDDIRVLKYF